MERNELGPLITKFIQEILKIENKTLRKEALKALLHIFSTKQTYASEITALEEKFWYLVYKLSGDIENVADPEKINHLPNDISFNKYAIFKYPENEHGNRPFYGTILKDVFYTWKDELKKIIQNEQYKSFFLQYLNNLLTRVYYQTYSKWPPREVIELEIKNLLSILS